MFQFKNLVQTLSRDTSAKFFSTSTNNSKNGKSLLYAFTATTLFGGLSYYTYNSNKSQSSTPPPQNNNGRQLLNVCITGAAGHISYNLIPQLLNGQIFGPNVDVDLRLLDVPSSEWLLRSLHMQIQDCDFGHVRSISYGSKPEQLFKDADLVIYLGGLPRRPGMERKDLLKINGEIFIEQGKALDKVAKKTVKNLIVANPPIANTLILSDHAPSINKKNFTSLSRLDQNRAVAIIASKANVDNSDVKNVIVWGNHSTQTMFPDFDHGTILGQKIKDIITDSDFLNKEFIKKVQNRGNEILVAQNSSTVMSGAVSIRDHIKDWYQGTKEGEFVSMGVYMDGTAYNIPKGIFFSMPVTCQNFDYEIVQNLEIGEIAREQIDSSKREILEEKQQFYDNHK